MITVFALCVSDEVPNVPGVYAIRNRSGRTLYVGSTKNLKDRYRDHLGRLLSKSHPNTRLQRAFNQNRTVLFFRILECCTKRELVRCEEKYLKRWGGRLLNGQRKAGSGHYGSYF